MLVWVVNRKESSSDVGKYFEQCLSLLPSAEQTRLRAFAFEKDAFSSLIGQMLPRAAICHFNPAIPLHALQFQRTSTGRPFITIMDRDPSASNSNIIPDFNVTHHGDYVAFIMPHPNDVHLDRTSDIRLHRVGIDLTHISMDEVASPDTFLGYFGDQFADVEWEWIRSGTQSVGNRGSVISTAMDTGSVGSEQSAHASNWEIMRRFHCLWALKEAYVKGIGCGITVNLHEIVFLVSPYDSTNPSTIKILANTIICFRPTLGLHGQFRQLWPEPLSVTLQINQITSTEWSFQVDSVDKCTILCMACKPQHHGTLSFEMVKWHDLIQMCGIAV
ncbi:hypothetical protein BASA62_006943 [Batrachochytrium salamandrivorans]|nr:hypothetical protein BASA62_006943 [Batrachochytrium salamandrivorans]